MSGGTTAGPVRVITPPAELDGASSALLESTLLACSPREDIVLDFSDVEFCDSLGVRAIVRAYRRHNRNGGSVRLRNIRTEVLRVFEVTDLVRVLVDHPDGGPEAVDVVA
jgi:anti-anti-sigma factor